MLCLPLPVTGSEHLWAFTPQCDRLYTMVSALCWLRAMLTRTIAASALIQHCIIISDSYAEQPTVSLQHPFLWLHAQITAFPSFCAFKNFSVLHKWDIKSCQCRFTSRCWIWCDLCVIRYADVLITSRNSAIHGPVSSPEFEWCQHQHHSRLPPASPACASPVLADVPSEATFGIIPSPLLQPQIVLGLLFIVLAVLWLLCHPDQLGYIPVYSEAQDTRIAYTSEQITAPLESAHVQSSISGNSK